MPIAALEALVDAVVAVDADGFLIIFNAAAERLWGRDRTELIGRLVASALPDLAGLLAGGARRPRIAESLVVERPDGTRMVGCTSVSVFPNGAQAAIIRDVSEQLLWRDELELLTLLGDEIDGVVLITDADRRIVYVNRAFTDMFGHSRAEIMGRTSDEVFAERNVSAATLRELHRRVQESDCVREELLVHDKDGRAIWVRLSVNINRDEQGRIRHAVSAVANITEAKQLEMLQRDVLEAMANDLPIAAVMRLMCERAEAVAPDVICSALSVDEGGHLHVLAAPGLPPDFLNAVEGAMVGPIGACATAAHRGEPVICTDIETDPLWDACRHFVLPFGLKACWASPIKLRDGQVAGTFSLYFRDKRRPSSWHERVVSICLHLSMLAIERHATKQHIARLAHYDTLTGLPNRNLLRDRLQERLAGGARDKPLALLFLDIDRFKDVNDTLGHAVGDRLLVEAAGRLSRLVSAPDTVCRYGADEFVIVLDESDTGKAGAMAGRLIEQLLTPAVIENMLLPVSASIGICLSPVDGEDGDGLLKRADTAMHEAKAAGGSTFRFFSPEMNNVAQERLVLGAALREAILRNQLKLHYQPQVDCRTGRLRGVEALARWSHPVFGDVSPARFIALAEECGLIEAIGNWALREACGQLASWRKSGIAVPGVSVNLSAVHFRNAGLVGVIADTLARQGLAPDMLTVEITEGVIMDDDPATIETAKAIHDLGVRLSLDDFGTGYSSLSYLARLPIDELKVDRSFMRDLDSQANAQAVATAVIKIGQSLGLDVVAEGVENEAQRRFLTDLGCDSVQGFMVSRPLAPAAFIGWYADYCGSLGLAGAA